MARVEARLTKVGMTMQEATVAEIYVEVHERVDEGEALCCVETDKATVDVQSPVAGTVAEVLVNEEELIVPGQALMVIESGASA